ncbi:MAG: oligosaccharide flippase family protein [Anaerolineales bacterium]|nr:MAG: oligosaccharide flippase family protein [Anaerolineales bacterium]
MPPDQNHPSASIFSFPGQIKDLISTLSGQGAREGYLAAADQAVISASNFIATIILARGVSPTELGMYGVGFTALRLVRSLQEGLVIQPMNVFGASMDVHDFKAYATGSSLLQLLLALTSSGLAALGGWLLIQWGNDTAGPALFALWFSFLWWQLQEYIRRMLYTRSAVFHALANTILANLVRLILLLWWGTQAELSGIGGLHAIGWGSLAALLPGIWLTRNAWTKKPHNLIEIWKRNWGFGRWIMGSSLANWLAVEFYPILTAGMISFAAAGAYRALQNLVAPIHLLLRATDTFLTPRAARQYEQSGRPALGRTLKLIYLISGIPILGVLLFAVLFPNQLLGLLYGETYLAYSNGVVLMALFYALLFSYWPLQTAFKAARFSKPIFIANLAAITAMFTVGIWAILRWGVFGTIAGQALNALVVNIVLWISWLSGKSHMYPARKPPAD